MRKLKDVAQTGKNVKNMVFAWNQRASWITISDKIVFFYGISVVVSCHLECLRNRKCLQRRQSSEVFCTMVDSDSVLDHCSCGGTKKVNVKMITSETKSRKN